MTTLQKEERIVLSINLYLMTISFEIQFAKSSVDICKVSPSTWLMPPVLTNSVARLAGSSNTRPRGSSSQSDGAAGEAGRRAAEDGGYKLTARPGMEERCGSWAVTVAGSPWCGPHCPCCCWSRGWTQVSLLTPLLSRHLTLPGGAVNLQYQRMKNDIPEVLGEFMWHDM